MLRGSLSSRQGRPNKGQQRIVHRIRQWLGKSQSKGESFQKGKILTKIVLQSKEGTIDNRGSRKMS